MFDPPTGTVAFLFTDIEESTALMERYPNVVRDVLARHDLLLREEFLQSAYEAGANLAEWDRGALERPAAGVPQPQR
jgi:hypothetical protein